MLQSLFIRLPRSGWEVIVQPGDLRGHQRVMMGRGGKTYECSDMRFCVALLTPIVSLANPVSTFMR